MFISIMVFSINEYLRQEERRKKMTVSSYLGVRQTPGNGYGNMYGGPELDHDLQNEGGLSSPLTRARDFVMDIFAAEETLPRKYTGRLNRRPGSYGV